MPEPQVQVLFGIDTEPDGQWFDHRCTDVTNIQQLGRFHAELTDLGVRPTYLVTHSVVTNSTAATAIEKMMQCRPAEIGAHLHVWDNPPFRSDDLDRRHPAFAHELPTDLVHAKLQELTEQISRRFGPPKAYRAGRFGFCAQHVPVLESLGYRVDSSVTPLLDRRPKVGIPKELGGLGGRDYRASPVEPYHPDYHNDLVAGAASLLEVPLTVGLIGRTGERMRRLYVAMPAAFRAMVKRLNLARVVSASPIQFSSSDLLRMLECSIRAGRSVVNFTLHSSETVAGRSPNIRTEEDRARLMARIRDAIAFLQKNCSVSFKFLGDVEVPCAGR